MFFFSLSLSLCLFLLIRNCTFEFFIRTPRIWNYLTLSLFLLSKALPRAGLEFNLAALAVPSAECIHDFFFGQQKNLSFTDPNMSRELVDVAFGFLNFCPPGFTKTHLGEFHIK